MVTLDECLGFSGVSEEDATALAKEARVPLMIAVQMASTPPATRSRADDGSPDRGYRTPAPCTAE